MDNKAMVAFIDDVAEHHVESVNDACVISWSAQRVIRNMSTDELDRLDSVVGTRDDWGLGTNDPDAFQSAIVQEIAAAHAYRIGEPCVVVGHPGTIDDPSWVNGKERAKAAAQRLGVPVGLKMDSLCVVVPGNSNEVRWVGISELLKASTLDVTLDQLAGIEPPDGIADERLRGMVNAGNGGAMALYAENQMLEKATAHQREIAARDLARDTLAIYNHRGARDLYERVRGRKGMFERSLESPAREQEQAQHQGLSR